MKIAVIGTGIAGNVAAYHLSKKHEVSVFEKNDYIGGHTRTTDVVWEGQHHAIDTGFIVFNEKTYPNFIALLDELGVASKATEMSFSVKDEHKGLEYNGHSLNTLFAQRRNLFRPTFYRMIRDILRFNKEAPRAVETGLADLGLGEFLRRQGYSQNFIEHYVIPMGAAIWSTDPQTMQTFPAGLFVRFFENHGLLSVSNRPRWFVVQGGSREYVKPLVESFRHRIRINTPVLAVRRYASHVEVIPRDGPAERFDALFIASHSDEALAMLDDPSPIEQEVLGAIRYQENEAVLHTDATVLPRRPRAWAAWNYEIQPDPEQAVAVHYNMNILQGLEAQVPFCVTLNDQGRVDRHKVIDRVSFSHPVFNADSVAAQQRHKEINGANRTYYCGAYWRNGFHEDGVVSALTAVDHFNETNDEKLYLSRTG